MMRRTSSLYLTLGCLTLLVAGLSASAEVDAAGSISIVSQAKTYSFAQNIQFTAEFISGSPITEVTLLLTVQGDWQVFSANLPVPDRETQVAVSYTMDLQGNSIYPFSQVDYWWHVEALDGSVLETEPVSFRYIDNRYEWHEVCGDGVCVYWATDDPGLGHTAARIAREGLARIQAILPEPLTQEIILYIYPSLGELRSALSLANRDWAAAIAYPELGVILASVGDSAQGLAELQDTLSHEVAHFAIQQSAGGPDTEIPFWLQEGLATINESTSDPMLAVELEQAVANDTLFALETLCAPPKADQSSAQLFYAQSASLVRYLQNQYGNQVISQLLAAYGDGADCNGGVQRTVGLGLGDLDAEWVRSLGAGEDQPWGTEGQASGLAVWVGLVSGGTALASMFYLLRPRVRQSEIRDERHS